MIDRGVTAKRLLVDIGYVFATKNEAAAMDNLFVVERYDDTGTPGQPVPVPAPPPEVRLVSAIRIPADDVLLALIEGTGEQEICTALAAAGWRVDRITPATWAHADDVPADAASEDSVAGDAQTT